MSSEALAIEVNKLKKCYRIGVADEKDESLVGAAAKLLKSPIRNFRKYRSLYRFSEAESNGTDATVVSPDLFWALKNISFDVKPGEVVGIIGRNGAGKSTLLKILSRITEPTGGWARISGRVTSLLEVGTGFHDELTGRENIYLNATILGMTKAEVDEQYQNIVEFSGIRQFIDTPVKRYSSGMRVRLAFSVSAHLNAEIMIIDEVLAVGDASFQKKCIGKMEAISDTGRTILFVSHNMAAIQSLCTRAILLEDGQVIADGSVEEGIRQYFISIEQQLASQTLDERTDRKGGEQFRFTGLDILDAEGLTVKEVIRSGDCVAVRLRYRCDAPAPLQDVAVSISFSHLPGAVLYNCRSEFLDRTFSINPGEGHLTCTLPRFPLKAGRYSFNIAANQGDHALDWVKEAGFIDVEDGDFYKIGNQLPPDNPGVLVDFSWHPGNGAESE